MHQVDSPALDCACMASTGMPVSMRTMGCDVFTSHKITLESSEQLAGMPPDRKATPGSEGMRVE